MAAAVYRATLGVVCAYEKDVGDKFNFDKKLAKIKSFKPFVRSTFNNFVKNCHLQNTVALSKLVYCVLVVPNDFAKKVNCVTCPFIWNFKPNKI